MKKSLLICALMLVNASASAAEMVTTKNFIRAETDMQMKSYIDNFSSFGNFHHNRAMYDVTKQLTIRANTDTLYSFGVFDLTQPLTLTMPETNRYLSAMIVSQDHSTYAVYEGKHTLSEENIGTRYVFIILRTFVDPNDKSDLAKAHATQDRVKLLQKNTGSFEIPDWDEITLKSKREELVEIANLLPNSQGMFGMKDELNPVMHLLGTAFGWGGLPEADASYDIAAVSKNDGKTVYSFTVKNVPVDGFWSATVYNKDGYFDINDRGVYSLNSITARRTADGSTTIQFGDCAGMDNCLGIMDGWNYAIRMYRPQESILSGAWQFPKPTAH